MYLGDFRVCFLLFSITPYAKHDAHYGRQRLSPNRIRDMHVHPCLLLNHYSYAEVRPAVFESYRTFASNVTKHDRLYCRAFTVRHVGLDDYFMLAALAVVVAMSVMNIFHISWGTG